jgi:lipid-binding SYLF domain-containing protein
MKKREKNVSCRVSLVLVLAFFALLIQPALAADPVQQQGTVDKALVTYRNFMADEQMEWFHKNLKDAKALLIVPNLLKAGFVWGGSGGSGVLVVRDAKTGNWSQPAFYTIGWMHSIRRNLSWAAIRRFPSGLWERVRKRM